MNLYLTPSESEEYLLLLEWWAQKKAAASQIVPFIPRYFEAQQAFVNDPAKLKAALCTRRAGKSTMCADYVIETAIKFPGEIIPYIAVTRGHCKRIIWRPLIARLEESGIEFKANATELTLTLSNGAVIQLGGASDEGDADLYRGNRYPLVVVDECASFRSHFASMIEEILEPAMIDLNGTIALVGTPAPHCAGLFFEVTSGIRTDFSVHKWSILDNPHVEGARQWLDDRIKSRGWTEETPSYRREWLGEWVRSTELSVYAFSRTQNMIALNEIPGTGNTVLGIDLGFHDETAFAVLRYHSEIRKVFLVETWAASGMTISQIAEKYEQLRKKYTGAGCAFSRVVVDTGGLGRQIVEELRKRHGIPAEAAEKTSKADFIELCNDDFKAGRFLISERETVLADQLSILQWDADEFPRRIEDDRYANHRTDAMLYAWRECHHYISKEPEPRPAAFSQEWYNQQEEKMREEIETRFREENQDWSGMY